MKLSSELVIFGMTWGLLAFSDPYSILGISPDSNPEEIKKAYLKKARELHPDVSPLPKAQAEKAFKELQGAWETIQQKKTSPSPTLRAKESARKQAEDFFKKNWERGNWGADSFQGLSRWQKAQTLSSLSPLPARGPEEEGEWLAISHFLRSHQAEIITSKASELGQVLENIETYFALTAESVKDTRAGLLEPFEMAVLANSKSKEDFLESFQKRGERLLRTGSFSMGDSKRFFTEKFFDSVPLTDLEMAQDLLKTRLELIRQAPPTLHEAGFFLRILPKVFSSEEQLSFLLTFKDQLDSLPREVKRQGSFRDLQSRIGQARERVMRINPSFKKESPSFFRTFTEACSGVLKKLKK